MPVSVNVQTVRPRRPGLWTDGHNIFLYHHPKQRGAPIQCDFGVEVTRTFETMDEAYNAIDDWMTANRRESAGHSWEIYGDATPDPADTETTVVHLLK